MRTLYLWLLFTLFFSKLHFISSDDDCQVTQKPKLQIIFVVDEVLKFRNDQWVISQNQTASALFNLFKQNNFEAEYAVAGFVDYPDTANPHRGITKPEVCYFLIQELTADRDKLISALTKDFFNSNDKNVTNYNNDDEQSLTTAMLFSAVDKRLKWNSGFYDNQGNLVRKIMITMVYKKHTTVLGTPGNRKPPKADGTDKCETALIPEIEQLNQVLWDNQFIVVLSLLKLSFYRSLQLEKLYAELFASLLVPYYEAPISHTGGFINNPVSFSAVAYAKHLYDIIVQEVMSCDWEDPIGYNSLGL